MARVVAVSNYGQCRDGPGETQLEASDTICMLDSSFVDRLCSGKVLDIWPHEPCGGRYVITYGHFGARAQLKLPPPPARHRGYAFQGACLLLGHSSSVAKRCHCMCHCLWSCLFFAIQVSKWHDIQLMKSLR